MKRRIDETPVRRVTGIIKEEQSPGTPPQAGQERLDGSIAIAQKDVGNIKFANRYRRKLAIAASSPFFKYLGIPFPAIIIGNFEPEDYFPEEPLGGGFGLTAQLAANVSVVELENPTGSKALVVVEDLQATRLQTAGLIRAQVVAAVNFQQGGLTASGPGSRDGRSTSSVARIDGNTTNALVVGGYALVGASGLAQSPWDVTFPALLMPGTALQVFSLGVGGAALVNEGLCASFKWRVTAIPQG